MVKRGRARDTYMLGGEDLAAEDCAAPRGLRLPMRCNGAPDAAPEDEVRCAVGEEDTAATAAADSSALDAVVFPEEEFVPLADAVPLPKDGRS